MKKYLRFFTIAFVSISLGIVAISIALAVLFDFELPNSVSAAVTLLMMSAIDQEIVKRYFASNPNNPIIPAWRKKFILYSSLIASALPVLFASSLLVYWRIVIHHMDSITASLTNINAMVQAQQIRDGIVASSPFAKLADSNLGIILFPLGTAAVCFLFNYLIQLGFLRKKMFLKLSKKYISPKTPATLENTSQ